MILDSGNNESELEAMLFDMIFKSDGDVDVWNKSMQLLRDLGPFCSVNTISAHS